MLKPAINFINVLQACFLYKILAPKITKLCFGFEIFWLQNIGEKSTRKMLMKSTPGVAMSRLKIQESFNPTANYNREVNFSKV
jgi:hypothetical protein